MNLKYHQILSGYFTDKPLYLDESVCLKPNIRKLVELPWQQTMAEQWDEVTDTLCNLEFIQAKAVIKMTYELVRDFNEVLAVIPDNAENIREENKRQARMDKYTQDLIACARGEISRVELEIPECITPWTQKKIDAEMERIKTNPNRLDRLKDFLSFLGQEAGNLQSYASEFPHFTIQQAWNYSNNGPAGTSAEVISYEKKNQSLLLNSHSRPGWDPFRQRVKTMNGLKPVAITPNGERAISGSHDHSCIIWDLKTGQKIKTLEGHGGTVHAVAITPDGKKAISGSGDMTCILWDLESGQPTKILKYHTFSVNAVDITPDAKYAISGSGDHTCIIWDLTTGRVLNILNGHSNGIHSVGITPDAQTAISGSHDKTCIIWDLKTGQVNKILQGHNWPVFSVAITPDGKKAISGSWDDCIVWDVHSVQVINKVEKTGYPVAITPDGKKAMSCGSDWKVWDISTGKIINSYSGNENIGGLSITPDLKFAITSLTPDLDSKITNGCSLWNLQYKQTLQTLKKHKSRINSVSVTSDGKIAASTSSDGTTSIWNLPDLTEIKSLKKSETTQNSDISSAEITSDGYWVIIGSENGTCEIWNLGNGRLIKFLENIPVSPVKSSILLPDGKNALVHYHNGDNIVWNLDYGQKVRLFKWDLDYGQKNEPFNWNFNFDRSGDAISVTPDGKMILSGSGMGRCILWNIETGEIFNNISGHTSAVKVTAISPDGKSAISGSYDGTCIIWDLRSGKHIGFLNGHRSSISSIEILPSGKFAISGSRDQTCILWNIASDIKSGLFTSESYIRAIKYFPLGIILGQESGEISVLKFNNDLFVEDSVILTIRRIWDFKHHQYLRESADCPLCGHRLKPPVIVMETIESITKKAGLKPGQSPCLDLPPEAWEDPGLLSVCPNCSIKLKFNPFIAGGNNNPESKWKFWKKNH